MGHLVVVLMEHARAAGPDGLDAAVRQRSRNRVPGTLAAPALLARARRKQPAQVPRAQLVLARIRLRDPVLQISPVPGTQAQPPELSPRLSNTFHHCQK